ncbi:MAG: serine protease, partial [Fuerstiella sp.]
NAAFDIALDADTSEAVLDLAKLKTPPGEYTIAFYGSAVAKYGYLPEAVPAAEAVLTTAKEQAAAFALEAKNLAAAAASAPAEQKAAVMAEAQAAAARQKAADAEVKAADTLLKKAAAAARPKDIVDIVVSTPISIRVNP